MAREILAPCRAAALSDLWWIKEFDERNVIVELERKLGTKDWCGPRQGRRRRGLDRLLPGIIRRWGHPEEVYYTRHIKTRKNHWVFKQENPTLQNQHRLRAVRAILFRPTVSKRLTPGLERLLPALKKDRKGRERGHKSEARRPFTFTF